ncbi:MAG: MFS transporter, partial [Gaiella sp.]
FGVAVLAAVFAHVGGYETGDTFTDGSTRAVYVGAGAVALGAIAAFAMGRTRRTAPTGAAQPARELSLDAV